jgi:hypothetical protein
MPRLVHGIVRRRVSTEVERPETERAQRNE